MKPNQKSITNNIENFLCPMEYLRVTQADNMGTHKGTYATDSAGKDTGRDPVYMPFTGVLKVIDSTANGNAIVLQSVNKVRFANGQIDIARLMIIHDNDRTGWVVGKTYPQGTRIAMEGTAGNASGNHAHIEVGTGVYSHIYDKNNYGVYHMPGNMPIEQACFADNTIISGLGSENWAWKYTKDIVITPNNGVSVLNSIPTDFVNERATFICDVDKINIRRSPSLNGQLTGDWYEKNMSVAYDGFVKREGYVWISWIGKDTTRRWMAVREIKSNKAYGRFK